ncbi:hypothetical protein GCM10027261_34880 [Geodermatophilus arenarius]
MVDGHREVEDVAYGDLLADDPGAPAQAADDDQHRREHGGARAKAPAPAPAPAPAKMPTSVTCTVPVSWWACTERRITAYIAGNDPSAARPEPRR